MYPAHPEKKFALTEDWESCDFDDEDAFVRGFIDLVLETPNPTLTIYEYKTGGIYPEHVSQRALYGLVGLLLYPEYADVRVIGVYFDKLVNEETTYPRSMIKEYKYMWNEKLTMIDKDDEYIPMPSFKCRFCDFSKYNGGPCEF
jgi:hypothetical protein